VRVTSSRIRLTAIAFGCALLGGSLSDWAQNPSVSWPVDHIAALSFGLELILVGALFTPIALWVVTGDFHHVGVLILDEVQRLAREARKLHQISAYAFSSIRLLAIGSCSNAHCVGRADELQIEQIQLSDLSLTAFESWLSSTSNDITDVSGGPERFMPAWFTSPKVRPPMQVSF
jgi:hypothetical protein